MAGEKYFCKHQAFSKPIVQSTVDSFRVFHYKLIIDSNFLSIAVLQFPYPFITCTCFLPFPLNHALKYCGSVKAPSCFQTYQAKRLTQVFGVYQVEYKIYMYLLVCITHYELSEQCAKIFSRIIPTFFSTQTPNAIPTVRKHSNSNVIKTMTAVTKVTKSLIFFYFPFFCIVFTTNTWLKTFQFNMNNKIMNRKTNTHSLSLKYYISDHILNILYSK